jgi:hypothetical protein
MGSGRGREESWYQVKTKVKLSHLMMRGENNNKTTTTTKSPERGGVVVASVSEAGSRGRPGRGSLRGLEWLARVGPVPVEAWAVGMGWSVRVAYSHAARLQAAGWLARSATVVGHGPLLSASREGVAVLGSPLTPAPAPAAMWWAHLRGCAWAAAWLTVRGRQMQAPRETMVDSSWVGELRWRDGRGEHRSGHRPDLAWITRASPRVAVEVELARKSTPRLKAIVALHARWRQGGHSGGVIYVCADENVCERVRSIGAARGLGIEKGGGLRVLTLADVRGEAIDAWTARTHRRSLVIAP